MVTVAIFQLGRWTLREGASFSPTAGYVVRMGGPRAPAPDLGNTPSQTHTARP